MTKTYEKAYTEVIEILKHLPKEEYNLIPKEKIDFFEDNMDKNYYFTYDVELSLKEQNVLRETSIIILSLFKDFFANDPQKEKLDEILNLNEQNYQNELRKKYNPEEIFKKQEKTMKGNTKEELLPVEIKEDNFFIKTIKKIFRFFK